MAVLIAQADGADVQQNATSPEILAFACRVGMALYLSPLIGLLLGLQILESVTHSAITCIPYRPCLLFINLEVVAYEYFSSLLNKGNRRGDNELHRPTAVITLLSLLVPNSSMDGPSAPRLSGGTIWRLRADHPV